MIKSLQEGLYGCARFSVSLVRFWTIYRLSGEILAVIKFLDLISQLSQHSLSTLS